MVTNNATNTPQLAVKGDLMAGQTFPTIPVVVPIGSDNQVLTADSSQTAGMKWAFSGAGASIASFMAYRNANSAGITGNGTTATIVFDVAPYNIGSAYNTGTGIFTAPVQGVYIFGTHIVPYVATNTSGSTTFTILQISPLGVGAFIVCQAGMAVNRNLDYCNIGAGGSAQILLTAGQTVKVEIGWYGLGAGAVGITGLLSSNPRSFFWGSLLEQTA